jgi:hypothetical protein
LVLPEAPRPSLRLLLSPTVLSSELDSSLDDEEEPPVLPLRLLEAPYPLEPDDEALSEPVPFVDELPMP